MSRINEQNLYRSHTEQKKSTSDKNYQADNTFRFFRAAIIIIKNSFVFAFFLFINFSMPVAKINLKKSKEIN